MEGERKQVTYLDALGGTLSSLLHDDWLGL